MTLEPALRATVLEYQKNEITEYYVYTNLARMTVGENRAILERIATDEKRHSRMWASVTQQEVKPDLQRIVFYTFIARLFGFTFAIRLMERGEESAQEHYNALLQTIPMARTILEEEQRHEADLLTLLDEDRLRYIGSMVLGVNDALVELTGALAGLTLALQNTHLIALTGSITGIAAALSMGASEYLSTKAEKNEKSPLQAALYTGGVYFITVILLVLPYAVLSNFYVCLALTLLIALCVIAFFNYYIAVVQEERFWGRFLEMAGLSMAVAAFSFLVGLVMRQVFGIEV